MCLVQDRPLGLGARMNRPMTTECKGWIVGLYWFSFEGVHFDALLISGEDASMHELGYLYRCAN